MFNLVRGHDSIAQGEILQQDHHMFLIMPVYAGSIAHCMTLDPPMSQERLLREGKAIKVSVFIYPFTSHTIIYTGRVGAHAFARICSL